MAQPPDDEVQFAEVIISYPMEMLPPPISRRWVGAVVPIPTLPAEVIRMRSELFVLNAKPREVAPAGSSAMKGILPLSDPSMTPADVPFGRTRRPT